jgi:predicted RNA-binding Zn-ribbon protein involved in translation (DUF1610 family)
MDSRFFSMSRRSVVIGLVLILPAPANARGGGGGGGRGGGGRGGGGRRGGSGRSGWGGLLGLVAIGGALWAAIAARGVWVARRDRLQEKAANERLQNSMAANRLSDRELPRQLAPSKPAEERPRVVQAPTSAKPEAMICPACGDFMIRAGGIQLRNEGTTIFECLSYPKCAEVKIIRSDKRTTENA